MCFCVFGVNISKTLYNGQSLFSLYKRNIMVKIAVLQYNQLLSKSNCKRSFPPEKHDWLIWGDVCLFVCLFVSVRGLYYCVTGEVSCLVWKVFILFQVQRATLAPDWRDITWRGFIITKTFISFQVGTMNRQHV